MNQAKEILKQKMLQSKELYQSLLGCSIQGAGFVGSNFVIYTSDPCDPHALERVVIASPDDGGEDVKIDILQIPRGWKPVLDHKIAKEVIASGPEISANRFITILGTRARVGSYEICELMTRLEPSQGKEETNAAYRIRQDGIRYAVDRESHVVIQEIAYGHFSTWKARPGYETHDICHYCGVSNTGVDEEGNLTAILIMAKTVQVPLRAVW